MSPSLWLSLQRFPQRIHPLPPNLHNSVPQFLHGFHYSAANKHLDERDIIPVVEPTIALQRASNIISQHAATEKAYRKGPRGACVDIVDEKTMTVVDPWDEAQLELRKRPARGFAGL